jgi:hypothetical protein
LTRSSWVTPVTLTVTMSPGSGSVTPEMATLRRVWSGGQRVLVSTVAPEHTGAFAWSSLCLLVRARHSSLAAPHEYWSMAAHMRYCRQHLIGDSRSLVAGAKVGHPSW